MNIWWKIGLSIALVVALFFGVNRYNAHQQGIGYQKAMAEVTARDNETMRLQLAEIGRLNGLIKEANDAAKKREEANRLLAARNAELLGSMRDTDAAITAAVGHATAAALADATRALIPLFEECRGAYEEMGRAAAGHLNDARKLVESWPRKKD